MASASSRSPRTAATPVGKVAFSGARVSARTLAPLAASWLTTWEPMRPVLPVTRMDMVDSGSGWRAVAAQGGGSVPLSTPAGRQGGLFP